jgi:hypothetical protein
MNEELNKTKQLQPIVSLGGDAPKQQQQRHHLHKTNKGWRVGDAFSPARLFLLLDTITYRVFFFHSLIYFECAFSYSIYVVIFVGGE